LRWRQAISICPLANQHDIVLSCGISFMFGTT
jgi:hypothetical protein